MYRSFAIACFILLLVAAVALVFFLSSPTGSPSKPEIMQEPPVTGITSDPKATNEIHELAVEEPQAEAANVADFATAIVCLSSAEVGTDLPILQISLGYRDPDRYVSMTQESDASGQASFKLPANVKIQSITIPRSKTTASLVTYPSIVLSAGEKRQIPLEIGRGGTLQGQVVDAQGQAVPEATVLLWEHRTRDFLRTADREIQADQNGQFEVGLLGAKFVITAHTETLACSKGLRGTVDAGKTVEGLTIHLMESTSLQGVVLGPDRNPLEGITVKVGSGLNSFGSGDGTGVNGITYFQAGYGQAESDKNGLFEITGLPLKGTRVTVFSKPYLR